MSTDTKRKAARREATPEQKAAAIERKKGIREMFAKISALPIEKRVILAHQYGLRTAGAGHQLSPSNTLLVMMQFPNASVVGGFEQWRKAGRVVKKGVKAIGIWVPVRGKESEAEGGDDTFFIIGNVFDISQTVDAATGADYDGSGWTAPAGEVMAPEAVAFPEGREVLQLGWTPDAPHALPAPVEVVEAAPVAEYEAPEVVEVVPVEVMEVEAVPVAREVLKPSKEPLAAGELRAVAVEQLTKKHHKTAWGYGVMVRYTWEDGTTSDGEVSASKLRDLPRMIERDARDVAAGGVSCQGGMIIKRFVLG